MTPIALSLSAGVRVPLRGVSLVPLAGSCAGRRAPGFRVPPCPVGGSLRASQRRVSGSSVQCPTGGLTDTGGETDGDTGGGVSDEGSSPYCLVKSPGDDFTTWLNHAGLRSFGNTGEEIDRWESERLRPPRARLPRTAEARAGKTRTIERSTVEC